jgi:hypothetical protein
MIEEKDSYECTKCRLTFTFHEDFQSHLDSKHSLNGNPKKVKKIYKEKEDFQEKFTEKNNKFLNQINKIESEMMDSLKYLEDELNSSPEELKENKDLKPHKDFITEETLDIGVIYTNHDEVEEVKL